MMAVVYSRNRNVQVLTTVEDLGGDIGTTDGA